MKAIAFHSPPGGAVKAVKYQISTHVISVLVINTYIIPYFVTAISRLQTENADFRKTAATLRM